MSTDSMARRMDELARELNKRYSVNVTELADLCQSAEEFLLPFERLDKPKALLFYKLFISNGDSHLLPLNPAEWNQEPPSSIPSEHDIGAWIAPQNTSVIPSDFPVMGDERRKTVENLLGQAPVTTKYINLSGTYMTTSAFDDLSRLLLRTFESLEILDISWNRITFECVPTMKCLLREIPSLKFVIVVGNYFVGDIEMLFQSLTPEEILKVSSTYASTFSDSWHAYA